MSKFIGKVVKHKNKWGYVIWNQFPMYYKFDPVEKNNNFSKAYDAKKKMKQRLCELQGENFLEKHPQYKEMK